MRRVWAAWDGYTPAWSSAGTQPAIGNGSLHGKFRRDGTTGWVRLYIAVGTSTTFGTGEWRLSLPSGWVAESGFGNNAPDAYQTGTGLIVPNAANAYDIVGWVQPGTSVVRLIYPNPGPSQSIANTVPVAWTASIVNFLSLGPMAIELDPS